MIDWIKAIIPFRHSTQINDGEVVSIDRNGEIEWTTKKRMSVLGSFDAHLQVQSDRSCIDCETGEFTHILMDGNPAKFIQGHNLWGTDDLTGLVFETVLKLSKILNIVPTPLDWEMIVMGHYELLRVDSTMMLDLGSLADVKAFLYSAERTAHLKFKGQGQMVKGTTLYFGKHSRRESLKMYAKGVEIRVKGHELPKELSQLPELYKWADKMLRIEVVTRSMELKDRGLRIARNWADNTPDNVINRLLTGLNMSEQHTLTAEMLDGLPPRLIAVYHLWKEGHDLKKMYPEATFRRYRNSLKEKGIDIAVKQGNRSEPSPNIIEFRRVLRPERCEQVPAWAYGTDLYFEPRAKAPSYLNAFPLQIVA